MSEIGQAFITRSRYHLSEDFLPKLEQCVAQLTDDQVWWRPNEHSNSIGNLLLHLSGNARQWIVAGLGSAPDARNRDAEFAQRDVVARGELLALLKQTLSDVDETLARLDAARLLDSHTIQGLDVSALEAILHVVEHFSMHTGQIIMMTKMLTDSELSFYEFVDAKPVMKWKSDGNGSQK